LDTAFIEDGMKLVSYSDSHVIRIHDIVDLAVKQVFMDMSLSHEGWMDDQDGELLFWVPLEHWKVLCLPHVEAIGDRPAKGDLSRFRYGSKWTECID